MGINKLNELISKRDQLNAEIEDLQSKYPKVGNWYKSPKYGKELFYVTNLTDEHIYGYGFNWIDNWIDKRRIGEYNNYDYELATDSEVLDRLKVEAERRGFVSGANVKSLLTKNTYKMNGRIEFRLNDSKLEMWHEAFSNKSNKILGEGFLNILKDGVWAEVAGKPIPVINGYEMHLNEWETEVSFGCVVFKIDDLKEIYNATEGAGITGFELGEGVYVPFKDFEYLIEYLNSK